MNKKSTATVVSAIIGKEIESLEIENNFTSFQMVVGETINFKGLPDNILLVPVNESTETALQPNLVLMDGESEYLTIKGNAYFVAVDEKGNITDLNSDQIDIIFDAFIDGKFVHVEYNEEKKKVVGYAKMACDKMGLDKDKEQKLLSNIIHVMNSYSDEEVKNITHESWHTVIVGK